MSPIAVFALGLALVGCGGRNGVDAVAHTVDWPRGCTDPWIVHVERPLNGEGSEWRRFAADQALIECGMGGGPAVTYTRFPNERSLRTALNKRPPDSRFCIASTTILQDLLERNPRGAFKRACQKLHGTATDPPGGDPDTRERSPCNPFAYKLVGDALPDFTVSHCRPLDRAQKTWIGRFYRMRFTGTAYAGAARLAAMCRFEVVRREPPAQAAVQCREH